MARPTKRTDQSCLDLHANPAGCSAPEVVRNQFEAFWKQYPRRDAKGRARLAFARALKKVPFPELMIGLASYPFSADPQFLPLPATWLNDERWLQVEFSRPATVVIPRHPSSWRDDYDEPELSSIRPPTRWHQPDDEATGLVLSGDE
jgi:hypothetical protein